MTGLLSALLWLARPAAAQRETPAYEARSGLLEQGGFPLFLGIQGPLSYAAATPAGLPPGAVGLGEVRGESCQHGLSIPFGLGLGSWRLSGAAGKGGFERALADIRRRHPDLMGVYDVKVDNHIVSVLTVYQRLCTEVTARGYR